MAAQYTRVSPGRYRDNKTGKIINSAKDPNKKAGATPDRGANPVQGTNPQTGNPSTNPVGTNPPKAVSNQGLIDLASGLVGTQLQNPTFQQPFSYETQAPTVAANLGGVRELGNQAFEYLNKDITEREMQDREATQQTLLNRGININNPEDPTYKRFMRDLERKYQAEREGAQNQAFQQGLQGTTALGGLEQQQFGTAFNQALGANTERYNNLGQLVGAYQAPQQIRQQGQALSIQRQAANRPRGGGAPVEEGIPTFNPGPAPTSSTR